MPLVILADQAGGDWPEAARQAAIALSAKAGEDNPMSALLLAIWLCWSMVDGLNSMEDRKLDQRFSTGSGVLGLISTNFATKFPTKFAEAFSTRLTPRPPKSKQAGQ